MTSKQTYLDETARRALTETHHRVRNTFQNLISFIQIQFSRSGLSTPEDVKKLTTHIRSLSAIHDLVSAEVNENGAPQYVRLDRLLEALAQSFPDAHVEFNVVPCRISARQSVSLCVIAAELIRNGEKYGCGRILVNLSCAGEHGTLSVECPGGSFPEDFELEKSKKQGLTMVTLLATSDLGGTPKFYNDKTKGACVELIFPINVKDSNGTK